jgi:23S rRNA pseudouridine2605 synthase
MRPRKPGRSGAPARGRSGAEGRGRSGARGPAAPTRRTKPNAASRRAPAPPRPGRSRPAHRHGARGASAEPERLQKVLARAGLASRREAEEWIRAGRITVNGAIATLGVRVSSTDDVRLDGRVVHQRAVGGGDAAFICHRSPGENLRQPEGDEGGESSTGTALMDRLPRRAGRRFIPVSPMPRIDGGLELVTSDGELAARLQRGVRHLSSEFSVRVKGELSEEQRAQILEGTLDSGDAVAVESCEPAGGEAANRWYSLQARGASGKEVRQLFERQGALVSRVLRTRLGPLALERTLGRGRFRALTPEEIGALTANPAPATPPDN